MNVLARALIACLPLLCGCGESDEANANVDSDSRIVDRTSRVQDPMPQMFGPVGDALLSAAEREIEETQKLVRDLERQGLAQDDLVVIDELARKIRNGTMTSEDEKRLRRMTRAAERQLELERLRLRHYPPPPPPSPHRGMP